MFQTTNQKIIKLIAPIVPMVNPWASTLPVGSARLKVSKPNIAVPSWSFGIFNTCPERPGEPTAMNEFKGNCWRKPRVSPSNVYGCFCLFEYPLKIKLSDHQLVISRNQLMAFAANYQVATPHWLLNEVNPIITKAVPVPSNLVVTFDHPKWR